MYCETEQFNRKKKGKFYNLRNIYTIYNLIIYYLGLEQSLDSLNKKCTPGLQLNVQQGLLLN